MAYNSDTDGAVNRIAATADCLGTGCLVAVLEGNLGLANDIALGLKSLKSAIEFLEKTRYGRR